LPYKDLGNPWRTILPSFPKSHVTKSALTYKRTEVGPSSTTDFPKDLLLLLLLLLTDRHIHIYTQIASQPARSNCSRHAHE
jgi:hypothetical protein